MNDLGYIKTEPCMDHQGNVAGRPVCGQQDEYAWRVRGGGWNGWFATLAEAIDDAPVGAHLVHRHIKQELIGIKGETKWST